ncbi:hypothetical protein PUN28_019645 [Cardiocondyla obscurior]|uniref:Secreted protein n=1 Tax=Cardiocondyla obscurior TaxID=286306 RepID=A0AAW2EAJ5_9HYME
MVALAGQPRERWTLLSLYCPCISVRFSSLTQFIFFLLFFTSEHVEELSVIKLSPDSFCISRLISPNFSKGTLFFLRYIFDGGKLFASSSTRQGHQFPTCVARFAVSRREKADNTDEPTSLSLIL